MVVDDPSSSELGDDVDDVVELDDDVADIAGGSSRKRSPR